MRELQGEQVLLLGAGYAAGHVQGTASFLYEVLHPAALATPMC
jgi:hypothetical protein